MDFHFYSNNQNLKGQPQFLYFNCNDHNQGFDFFPYENSFNHDDQSNFDIIKECDLKSKYSFWQLSDNQNYTHQSTISNKKFDDTSDEGNLSKMNQQSNNSSQIKQKQTVHQIHLQCNREGSSDQQFLDSQRKNNYISKTIFTQFKKLLKSQKSGYKDFFKYREYEKNHVTLLEFQKIFSFVENHRFKQDERYERHEKLQIFKEFLNQNLERLLSGAVKYQKMNKLKQAKQYRFYLNLIIKALHKGQNYSQRLSILYRGNKYKSALSQIQYFIQKIIEDNQ